MSITQLLRQYQPGQGRRMLLTHLYEHRIITHRPWILLSLLNKLT